MIQTGEFQGFEVEVEDPGILVITFNRPDRLNGMNAPMKRDLLETLTQAAMEDSVRVVLFTGSGRAFSAGDDISGKDRGERGEQLVPDIHRGHDNVLGTINGLRKISQPVNTAIRGMDKLTIAAMNGVAVQTGFSLALSCDFRIASTAARMGSGTLRFGLLPDEGGHYLLLKRSLYNAADQTWEQSLEDIAARTPIGDHHPDSREGVAAFRDKRQPAFNAWLNE